jgi:hypothetical protein
VASKLEEKNKELVLEAFDTLFNKRDFAAAEKILVSQLHSAQRPHPTGSRRPLQPYQEHPADAEV